MTLDVDAAMGRALELGGRGAGVGRHPDRRRRPRAGRRRARRGGQRAGEARRPDRARRGAGAAGGGAGARRRLAADRRDARRDPRAVHDVRRRERAGPGRRGSSTAPTTRRPGRPDRCGTSSATAGSTTGPRSPPGSAPRSPPRCYARSSALSGACSLFGGGVSERPKEHASKACEGNPLRGFKSHRHRQHDDGGVPGSAPGGRRRSSSGRSVRRSRRCRAAAGRPSPSTNVIRCRSVSLEPSGSHVGDVDERRGVVLGLDVADLHVSRSRPRSRRTASSGNSAWNAGLVSWWAAGRSPGTSAKKSRDGLRRVLRRRPARRSRRPSVDSPRRRGRLASPSARRVSVGSALVRRRSPARTSRRPARSTPPSGRRARAAQKTISPASDDARRAPPATQSARRGAVPASGRAAAPVGVGAGAGRRAGGAAGGRRGAAAGGVGGGRRRGGRRRAPAPASRRRRPRAPAGNAAVRVRPGAAEPQVGAGEQHRRGVAVAAGGELGQLVADLGHRRPVGGVGGQHPLQRLGQRARPAAAARSARRPPGAACRGRCPPCRTAAGPRCRCRASRRARRRRWPRSSRGPGRPPGPGRPACR